MGNENEFIRFDWAMKHMLRDKSNFEILEGFISVLLGQEIKIEEILESESNQESDADKFNRVDIKAKDCKGHIIIVEVQLTTQYHYLQRILYGTCKAVTEHLKLGEKYDKVKKVYSVSLLYCDFGQGDDYIYHGTTDFKGLHTGNDLIVRTNEDGVIIPHLPREVFPEYYLLRINKFDKMPDTPLDEWMDYLKTGVVKEDTRTPGLQRVREKLRVLSMTKAQKEAYFRHLDLLMQQNDAYDTAISEGMAKGMEEGIAKGMAEGIAQGMVKGREEEKLEIARKMLAGGLSPEMISSFTGLSESDIQSL
ncbi:MAG: Rpn family recombination-promoting nuclease/putative transposase [Muribaculaceae bacterium]|nr:Rpn family recombination-promoting nuclease/putative transposase [Muribaculaceae bacterium]